MITYLILTIFFAMNFTLDSVERSKLADVKIPSILILARFILDAVIWPLRLMRFLWIGITKLSVPFKLRNKNLN